MDRESVMLAQTWWVIAPSTLNRLGTGPGGTTPFTLDVSLADGDDVLIETP